MHASRHQKARVGDVILDYRLAFVVIIALVLIPEQRLVDLHLLVSDTHKTSGGGEDEGHHHKGGNYGYGYYFCQRERCA